MIHTELKRPHRPWRPERAGSTILGLLLCYLVAVVMVSGHGIDTTLFIEPNSSTSAPDAVILDPKQPTEPFPLPKLNSSTVPALIVIDVQDCFLPGGAIPVAGGTDVVPVINSLRDDYYWRTIALSMDWHCEHHISFKTEHPNTPGPVELVYLNTTQALSDNGGLPELCNTTGAGIFPQVVSCPNLPQHPQDYVTLTQHLWPPHCVQHRADANIFSQLHVDYGVDNIIKKGTICSIDSYSAFEDNGGFSKTELQSILDQVQVNTVFITGLTLDFCVKFTALDAKKLGYQVFVVLDATKATSANNTQPAVDILRKNGIYVITSSEMAHLGLRKQAPGAVAYAFGVPMAIGALVMLALFIRFLLRPREAGPNLTLVSGQDGEDVFTTEDESTALLEHH